jgi:polyisoprenoid-binding protein YceI
MKSALALIALGGLLLTGCGDQAVSKTSSSSVSAVAPANDSSGGTTEPDARSIGSAAATGNAADRRPLPVDSGVTELTPENTKIQFVGTKPGGKHEGGFAKFTGRIEMGPDDFKTARIFVEIDMSSTWTDETRLTQHLLNADFFEVRTYPKSQFVSTSIEPGDKPGSYTVVGDLTLHGVTKSIRFPATVALGGKAVSLRSQFTINRNDFGISYGPGKVDDEVTISVAVGGHEA